eukprot:5198347-Amphidinium_carterae.1
MQDMKLSNSCETTEKQEGRFHSLALARSFGSFHSAVEHVASSSSRASARDEGVHLLPRPNEARHQSGYPYFGGAGF